MLDKYMNRMVKYVGIKYREERKEYLVGKLRESGSSAASPGGIGAAKVRPGANFFE